MSRRELRATVELLREELKRERALGRPALKNELVMLRREVSDLQSLVHLHADKRRALVELRRSMAEEDHRCTRLRRRLQRDFHPDKTPNFQSVSDVLTRISSTVNEELEAPLRAIGADSRAV